MDMPTMESVKTFKAAMDSDRGALGPFMICTDPAMVESAGQAGYDFVLLDMEHGTTTFQTASIQRPPRAWAASMRF